MQRSAVDYATHTWNWVTGCFHPCRDYCYGARMVKWFTPKDYVPRPGEVHVLMDPVRDVKGHVVPWPYGYEPTIHRHRMEEPLKHRRPARVFMSNMGDAFGEWMLTGHSVYLHRAFAIMDNCPQHRFLCLTKNPDGYRSFTIPGNVWCGTTVTGDGDLWRPEVLLDAAGLANSFAHRWLSWEPALGPLVYDDGSQTANDRRLDLAELEWLVIGAMTGPKAKPPETKWIEDAVAFARAVEIPVFLKQNLLDSGAWKGPAIREYPKELLLPFEMDLDNDDHADEVAV